MLGSMLLFDPGMSVDEQFKLFDAADCRLFLHPVAPSQDAQEVITRRPQMRTLEFPDPG